jgi:hypothetical protein
MIQRVKQEATMATKPTPNSKPNPTTPPGDQSLSVSEIVLEAKRKIEEIKKDLLKDLLALHEQDVQMNEAIQAGLNDILNLSDKSKEDYNSNKRKNLQNIFWGAIAGLLLVGMFVLIHRRIQAIK